MNAYHDVATAKPRMKALIVDDEQADRENLSRAVHRAAEDCKIKIDVRHAAGIGEMYEQLSRAAFDLLFLDVVLGESGSEGLNEIRRLRDSFPGLPIVLVTGHFIERVKQAIDDYWAEDRICAILDKMDYDANQLAFAIEKAREWSSISHSTGSTSPVPASTEARRVIERTLLAMTQRLKYHASAIDDLSQICVNDESAYGAICRELLDMNGRTTPTQGARIIHSVQPACWELRAAAEYRVYFRIQEEQAVVLRVTNKNRQSATIDWIKGMK